MTLKVTREEFIGKTYEELLDENVKLRELCRDVLAHEAIDCERCGYCERCGRYESTCYTAGIIMRRRARELGVIDE